MQPGWFLLAALAHLSRGRGCAGPHARRDEAAGLRWEMGSGRS